MIAENPDEVSERKEHARKEPLSPSVDDGTSDLHLALVAQQRVETLGCEQVPDSQHYLLYDTMRVGGTLRSIQPAHKSSGQSRIAHPQDNCLQLLAMPAFMMQDVQPCIHRCR